LSRGGAARFVVRRIVLRTMLAVQDAVWIEAPTSGNPDAGRFPILTKVVTGVLGETGREIG
jgi:hypothetical protein